MTLPRDKNGATAQVGGLGTSQDMTITASSAQSTAFVSPGCFAVRVVAATECRIAIGSNPTATLTTSAKIPAGIPEYFEAYVGQKLAVIGTSGVLNITEIV